MQSKASTVEHYLAELPEDRRQAIQILRKVILNAIDRTKVEETMQYGMIAYVIPFRVYPPGYHCPPKQPLPYICLGSQKNYLSLYMMGIYDGTGEAHAFKEAWKKAGKKLDMGKSCIRFKKADDLPLDVIADTIRKLPVEAYIARYESVINEPKGSACGPAEESGAKQGCGRAVRSTKEVWRVTEHREAPFPTSPKNSELQFSPCILAQVS